MAYIEGTSGDDRLNGGARTDFLHGLGGNDLLRGYYGSDALHGGDGDDTLIGGEDHDLMDGGDGDDVIDLQRNSGYGDVDAALAGAGDDLIIAADDGTRWNGFDYVDGGDGVDTYTAVDAGLRYSVQFYINLEQNLASELFRYDIPPDEPDDPIYDLLPTTGHKLKNVENIIGTPFGDVLIGDAGGNMISGAGGNDILKGRGGDDTLEGGDGANTMNGGPGDDIFSVRHAATYIEGISPDPHRIVGDTGTWMGRTVPLFDAFERPGKAGGDVIDLSGIDAVWETKDDDAFVFGGSGVGSLTITEAGGDTLIVGRVDADPAHDLRIVIEDFDTPASAYSEADFIL